MQSAPTSYVIVIHSGELTCPLMDAAESCNVPIRADLSVVSERLVEIRQERAGNGVQLADELPHIWQDMCDRHARGETISAIIGCPIMTADVIAQLQRTGIEVPKAVHLVTQLSAMSYRYMEPEHPGITALVEQAQSSHNLFEDDRAMKDASAHLASALKAAHTQSATHYTIPQPSESWAGADRARSQTLAR